MGTENDPAASVRSLVPWRSSNFQVMLASTFAAPLGVAYISPALPAIRDAFAVSDAQAGLVITVFAIPGIVAAPIVGMLADHYGRRRVLVSCLIGFGIAGTAIAGTSNLRSVFALRFVQGTIGGSILVAIAMTMVGDFYEGARRNAVMGVVTATVSLGFMVLPAIGGMLAERSWNTPFLLYAISAVIGVYAFVSLEEPDIDRGTFGVGYLRDVIDALPRREAIVLYGAVFFTNFLYIGTLFTAIPFLLSETYGLRAGLIGLSMTAISIVAVGVSAANGRFAQTRGNHELIALGVLGYGLGLLGAGVAPSLPLVIVTMLVFAAGHGLALPSLATALSDIVSGEFRGGIMTVRTSVIYVAIATSPAIVTLTGAHVGYETVLLAGGVVTSIGGVGALMASQGGTESSIRC